MRYAARTAFVHRHLLLAGFLLSLSACCGTQVAAVSRPVPLNDALRTLESDLRAVAPVPLSEAATPTGPSKRFIDAVGIEQCRQKSANPVIALATGAMTLQLQGQFQAGEQLTFTISATPSAASQTTVQRQEQQQLSVPLTFISLLGTPDLYFGQLASNYSALPDELKKVQLAELLKVRDSLRKVAHEAVDRYQATLPTCDKILSGTERLSVLLLQGVE